MSIVKTARSYIVAKKHEEMIRFTQQKKKQGRINYTHQPFENVQGDGIE